MFRSRYPIARGAGVNIRAAHRNPACVGIAFLLISAIEIDIVGAQSQCNNCTITLKPRTVLAGPVRGSDLDRSGVVAVMSQGQYIVSIDKGTGLAVFDAEGKAVRTIGTRGNGPGEFQSISSISVGRNDSIFVFEARRRILQVFARDFRYVRQALLPLASKQIVPLSDGRVVTSGFARTQSGAGFPLHISGAHDGKILRSFGAEIAIFGPANPGTLNHVVTADRSGRLWSASMNRYAITAWAPNLETSREIVRAEDWFIPWSAPPKGFIDVEKPQTQLIDLAVGDSNELTVLFSVPAVNWKPAAQPFDIATVPASQIPLEYLEKNLDSRIQIVDAVRNTVIGSAYVGEQLSRLIAPRIAIRVRETAQGFVEVMVFDLVLTAEKKRSVEYN